MPSVQHPRGTRAALDTLAGSSGLLVGQIYVITDEDRLAVATSASAYETFAKESEAGGGGDPGLVPLREVPIVSASTIEIKDLETAGYREVMLYLDGVNLNHSAAYSGKLALSDDNGVSYTSTMQGGTTLGVGFGGTQLNTSSGSSAYTFVGATSATDSPAHGPHYGYVLIGPTYIRGANLIRGDGTNRPVWHTHHCEHALGSLPDAIKLTCAETSYTGGNILIYGVTKP